MTKDFRFYHICHNMDHIFIIKYSQRSYPRIHEEFKKQSHVIYNSFLNQNILSYYLSIDISRYFQLLCTLSIRYSGKMGEKQTAIFQSRYFEFYVFIFSLSIRPFILEKLCLIFVCFFFFLFDFFMDPLGLFTKTKIHTGDRIKSTNETQLSSSFTCIWCLMLRFRMIELLNWS